MCLQEGKVILDAMFSKNTKEDIPSDEEIFYKRRFHKRNFVIRK